MWEFGEEGVLCSVWEVLRGNTHISNRDYLSSWKEHIDTSSSICNSVISIHEFIFL